MKFERFVTGHNFRRADLAHSDNRALDPVGCSLRRHPRLRPISTSSCYSQETMTALASFPGYSGQALEELLALDGQFETWTLVAAVEQGLSQRFGYGDSADLTAAERAVLAVLALEREVMNGGYSQFFTNSSVEFAPMVVEALKQIGCPKTADLTSKAIETLQLAELTAETIKESAQTPDEVRDKLLDEYDQEFFKYEERPDLKLFAYIRENHGAIRL